MARQLTIELVADSTKFEGAMKDAGGAATKMADKLDAAGKDAKEFTSKLDRAAEASDNSEGKFIGLADVAGGLGDVFGIEALGPISAFGLALGDLSGGFAAIAPAIKGFGAALMGPMGIVLLLAAALVTAYATSETFRDIVQGVFQSVKDFVSPILDSIGQGLKWIGGLFGDTADDSEDAVAQMDTAWDRWATSIADAGSAAVSFKDGLKTSLAEALDPMKTFETESLISFAAFSDNLIKNAQKVRDWQADIDTLMKMGATALARHFLEAGPSTATAADEATRAAKKHVMRMNEEIERTPGLIQRAADKWTQSFFPGMTSGQIAASVTNSLNPFGGGRAAGGPVTGGVPYVVGERGPELFVPNASGTIVPNSGASTTIVLQLDGRVLTKTVVDGLNREQRSSGVMTKLVA